MGRNTTMCSDLNCSLLPNELYSGASANDDWSYQQERLGMKSLVEISGFDLAVATSPPPYLSCQQFCLRAWADRLFHLKHNGLQERAIND